MNFDTFPYSNIHPMGSSTPISEENKVSDLSRLGTSFNDSFASCFPCEEAMDSVKAPNDDSYTGDVIKLAAITDYLCDELKKKYSNIDLGKCMLEIKEAAANAERELSEGTADKICIDVSGDSVTLNETLTRKYLRHLVCKKLSKLLFATAIVGGLVRCCSGDAPLIVYGIVAVSITAVMICYCMDKYNTQERKLNWKRMCIIGLISGICIAAFMDFIIPFSLLQGVITGILLPVVTGLIEKNTKQFEELGMYMITGGICGTICYGLGASFLASSTCSAVSPLLFMLLNECKGDSIDDHHSLTVEKVQNSVISMTMGYSIAVAINLMFPTLISGYLSTTLACMAIGAIAPAISEKLDKIIIEPVLEKACDGISGMFTCN